MTTDHAALATRLDAHLVIRRAHPAFTGATAGQILAPHVQGMLDAYAAGVADATRSATHALALTLVGVPADTDVRTLLAALHNGASGLRHEFDLTETAGLLERLAALIESTAPTA